MRYATHRRRTWIRRFVADPRLRRQGPWCAAGFLAGVSIMLAGTLLAGDFGTWSFLEILAVSLGGGLCCACFALLLTDERGE